MHNNLYQNSSDNTTEEFTKCIKKENTHLSTQSSVQTQPHCHQQSSSEHQQWTPKSPPNGLPRQQFCILYLICYSVTKQKELSGLM